MFPSGAPLHHHQGHDPPEPKVLKEGGELAQQRIVVQPSPTPAFEAIEAELSSFFICWCICSQTQRALMAAANACPERRSHGVVGKGRTCARPPRAPRTPATLRPRADAGIRAATGPSATRTRTAAKRAFSGPLVPRRQERERNARRGIAANRLAASTLGAEGTGCLAGRPVARRGAGMSTTMALTPYRPARQRKQPGNVAE